MQIVLSGNRVIAHGENCFLAMGGTVICEETGTAYQNATVAEVDDVPADIDSVGYEYHAGVFVPCAPYGSTSDGYLMVACDCGTPKKTGVKVEGDQLGTAAYKNASVTRAKLATDALYSPINAISPINYPNYEIKTGDLGKTLLHSWESGVDNVDTVYSMTDAVSKALPNGAEIAIIYMHGKSCSIAFDSNIVVDLVGEPRVRGATLKIPEKHGMVALKKWLYAGGEDYWLVTGNVEVV